MSVPGDDTAAVPAQTGAVGPTMPFWQLRAGLAGALAIAGTTIVAWTAPAGFFVFLLVLLGLGTVIWPQSHAPGLFLAAAALCALLDTDAEVLGWTFVAVFALHAAHLLSALCALAPWNANAERAALRPSMRRFVYGQAACQPLVLLAYVLTTFSTAQ